MTDQEKLSALMRIECIKLEGFAGVMPNGNIVDRREHPQAVPLQENKLLGIPKPQPVKGAK